MNDIKELYKDFMREALVVSNFFLYNGQDNTTVNASTRNDETNEYAVIEYSSNYPIVVTFDF